MNSTTLEAHKNITAVENKLFLMTSVELWSYKINVVFGFPAHSYIIWLIIMGTESVIASEIFNLNLSVCELCFSLNCLFGVLSYFALFKSLDDLCAFFIGLSITGRGLFQCLMCVERYLAVVHPVIFLKYKPLRYKVICCAAAWIITLFSCLGCVYTLTSDYNRFMWLCCIQLLLFVSITLFCCLAVLRALKHSGPGEKREKVEENHTKRKAFNLILITTVSMLIIFVPLIFAGFFFILTQINSNQYRSLGFSCFIMGGFVHPVLFLRRHVKLTCVCTSYGLKLGQLSICDLTD